MADEIGIQIPRSGQGAGDHESISHGVFRKGHGPCSPDKTGGKGLKCRAALKSSLCPDLLFENVHVCWKKQNELCTTWLMVRWLSPLDGFSILANSLLQSSIWGGDRAWRMDLSRKVGLGWWWEALKQFHSMISSTRWLLYSPSNIECWFASPSTNPPRLNFVPGLGNNK